MNPETYLLIMMAALLALYFVPIMFLVKFAKREHKDWRIAMAAGLLFTWLFAWLIILIVPKLSDEDHARINGPSEHKSFRITGVKLPKPDFGGASSDDFIKPALIGMGVCLGGAGLMVAWLMWFA